MPIPDYQTLMLPVLKLATEREQTNKACVEIIADQFSLSSEEREELLPSGKQTIIANRVHWAVTYMTKAGLIERPKRGTFTATDRGRGVIKNNPERLDIKFLEQFQEFLNFRDSSKQAVKPKEDEQPLTNLSETTATPEEQIEIASQEINSAVRDELLDRIVKANPTFFEKLIIDLMMAMGYGTSGSGQHLGKTNDGGIDGIINEDPLGLDVVFLQAKRYTPGNNIGVEKIREFAGSLDERGAVKGVFVTTSSFAQGAKLYAERSPKRLILIGVAHMQRRPVHMAVMAGNHRRGRHLVRSEGPHGHHGMAMKPTGWPAGPIGHVHGDVMPFLQVTDRQARLRQLGLEGKAASQQESNQIVGPHRRNLIDFFGQFAVTVDPITRQIRAQIGLRCQPPQMGRAYIGNL